MRKCIELGKGVRAIGDARIFIDIFVGGEEPEFLGSDGAAERGDSILARKRLFGIWFRIVEGISRVQAAAAVIVGSAAVPVVGATASGDNHASAIGPGSIGAELRRPHHEFLHGLRREILQKPANVVVVVIATVHRKIDVQAGAAAERNGGDARLGRV